MILSFILFFLFDDTIHRNNGIRKWSIVIFLSLFCIAETMFYLHLLGGTLNEL